MNNQRRILFIEDLPSDVELAERELRKGGLVFISKNVDTEIDLLEALDKFQPDIVICDYSMPLFDGMQALKIVLNHDPNLPVIMLTGSTNELIAVECMKSGATDYVIKEHITRLPFALTEALEKKKLKLAADNASMIIRASEERFHTLFSEMMEGFALHEIMCDNSGKPIDYRFLEMNPAFERLTGLSAKEVIGKSILEVLPDTEKYWIETYGKVALTGKPEVFENFSKELNKYYKVIAFSNKKNQFATVIEDITQRKHTDEELLASKNQYQQLFNEMLLGSALHELICNNIGEAIDYRTLDVNKGFEQMLGIKKEDVIGQLASTVLPEKELKEWLDIFVPVAKGKGSRHYEFYSALNCKFFEGVVFSPKNDQFAVTFNDVTKRKQSEISLRSTSIQLELALKSAKAGIWDWNVITGILEWSPQLFDLFGIDPLVTEASFDGWRAVVHPDDLVLAETRIEEALKKHLTLNSDYRVVFPDEEVRWINATGEGIYDDNGRPIQMIGICTDISERKRADEALLLEKENFRHSLDDFPLGVRIVSKEGITTYVNKAILDLYGFDSLEEFQRTPLKKRYTKASFNEAQKRKQLRTHGDLSHNKYEISINRKNGEIRNLMVYRKTILWNDVWQFQVIYDDITTRKKTEQEILEMKDILEKLNQHQNEIREKERELISREIHDQLGQALTSIKIDLNWLSERIDNDSKEGSKLSEIINLVTKTTKDVQRISLELRPGVLFDLGLSAALEWYLEDFMARTGINVIMDLEDIQSENESKNLSLYRVAQESLTNVLRHAAAKNVKIKLHKTRKDILLTIEDDGVGISTEKISSSRSLGLLGMSERVKQFNGQIEITNPVTGGTKISVNIPLK